MKWLISLIGVLFIGEIVFAPMLSLHFEPGLGFLVAAEGMAMCALAEISRKTDESEKKLRLGREIVFAYECLIIASANILAQPHVNSVLTDVGAVILGSGQTLILWLVFRNPRLVKPIEPPRSAKNLTVRDILRGFIIIIFAVGGAAIYVPRSLPNMRILPPEFQWPGVVLLYVALSCMALGLACEYSRPDVIVYVAAAFIATVSVLTRLPGNIGWYFLILSLFSFLWLVPGWPNWQAVRARNPEDTQFPAKSG